MSFPYYISLTGDCTNSSIGAATLSFSGTAPYTIGWDYNLLPTRTITGNTTTYTGISAGTYTFNVTASTVPVNDITGPVSFVVLSSNTATITTGTNPSCSTDNAYLTVNITSGNPTNIVYLYKDYTLINSANTVFNEVLFNNLSEGMYYAIIGGEGTCECETESVVIHTNPNVLDFDYYVVNNPACSLTNGKIYITGVTGVSPFTYIWTTNILQSGATTVVTGLTQGIYSLTIIDGNGCSLTKDIAVANANPLGLITYTLTSPSCFASDGVLNFYISGGTGPYFYLLSNGDSIVTYDTEVTFTNLNSGGYTLQVTDVALCNFTTSVSLAVPQSFSYLSTEVVNSQCQYNGGSILANILGGTPPYTYTLSNNSGTTSIVNSQFTSNNFSQLSSGVYTLTITDSSSACTYVSNVTVLNETSFDFTLTPQSSYCSLNSGVIQANVVPSTTASTLYTYTCSNGDISAPTTATTYSFTNLQPGSYNVSVSDLTGCTQTKGTIVDYVSPYNFTLFGTDCVNGSGGTISTLISDSDGPFDLIWSDNVNGQTGINLTGLTAGTYTLTVSGVSKCETTKNYTVTCNPPRTVSSSYSYSVGSTSYVPSSFLNFSNMLSRGYLNLISGHQDCKLNYARFFCDIELSGVTYSGSFYTSKNLTQTPSVSAFTQGLTSLVNTIPYIKDYEINLDTNTINFESDVIGGVEVYKDDVLTITVRIVYKISCRT